MVRVGGLALTDRADLENRIDRLADRIGAAPRSASVRTRPFMDAMKVMAGVSGWTVPEAHQKGTLPGRDPRGRVARESYAARSDFYTRPVPPTGVRALIARVERLARLSMGGAGSVALDAMGGAVNRVRPGDTAFVHRNALFLAQYIVSWPDRAPSGTVAGTGRGSTGPTTRCGPGRAARRTRTTRTRRCGTGGGPTTGRTAGGWRR